MCFPKTTIQVPPPPPMPDIEALLAEQPELEVMEEESPIAPEVRTRLDDIGNEIRTRGMAALRI